METCAICFESVASLSIALKCTHTFHSSCLQEWLPKHGTCPTCRSTSTPLLFVPHAHTESMQSTRFDMQCGEYSVATNFDCENIAEIAKNQDLEVVSMCPLQFIGTFTEEERDGLVLTVGRQSTTNALMSILIETSSLAAESEAFAINITSFDPASDELSRLLAEQLAREVRHQMEAQWERVGRWIDLAVQEAIDASAVQDAIDEQELPGYA